MEGCFNFVFGFLPQQDFDDDVDFNHAMCMLPNGRSIRRAAMTHEFVLAELGLPNKETRKELWAEQKLKADCAAAVAVAVSAVAAAT